MIENPIEESVVRLQKLQILKDRGINPYPAKSNRTHTIKLALEQFDELAKSEESITIVGRLKTIRLHGGSCFADLEDGTGKIQLHLSLDTLGEEQYKLWTDAIDRGDFIQTTGKLFVTKRGQQSLDVQSWSILSKTLESLPDKWSGLNDIEIRYRKRYLDLLTNENSMRIAKIRSVLVKEMRNYFDGKGFFEVETPILQTLYGGALAKPFTTHHNALDIPLYLRIAPELYLKRLIVGGFEKVYEVAKCFRNEGIDNNHNPEFTQIEFYWAYADYSVLMDLVEDMLPKLILATGLPLKFTTNSQEVDFTPPYPRVAMRDLIQQYAKINIEDYPDQTSMLAMAKKLHVADANEASGRGKIIDDIYKQYVRPFIVNPIFMIDHPVELSPLAKRKPENPEYVERFQLLCVGGNELCNAFSELNDPIDQENRFKEQVENKEAGDEESMPYDADFIDALKHGMPPTAGLGMGIDRLVKLLVDAQNLKEVILFPTLRPE